MPGLYENPIRFLKNLSDKIKSGWILIEFDYDREKVTIKKDDQLQKAITKNGRMEWESMKAIEAEIFKGTDRFYIL
jgi:hypothetical protein